MGSNQIQYRIDKLQADLHVAKTEIEATDRGLEPLVVRCGKDTLDKLELAMTKVYKLAVFIRGAYDDRAPDVEQRGNLLQQMVAAFRAMDETVVDGMRAMANQHDFISLSEDSKIGPVKSELEQLVQQIQKEMASIEDRMRASQSSIAMLEQNMHQQDRAVNSLRDRVRQAEEDQRAREFGFAMLTFGLGNVANNMEAAELGRQLDDACHRFEDTNNQLRHTLSNMHALYDERNHVESQLRLTQQADRLVYEVHSAAQAADFRSRALQGRFVPLRETAQKLLSKAYGVQQAVEGARAAACAKKDLTKDLLYLCKEALMDQALEDEARMVRDELINEYGGQLPSDIEGIAAELDGRIRTFSSLPSLRNGSALIAA